MSKILDITGVTYGRLTALYCVGTKGSGHAIWRWQCLCGEQKDITATEVKSGGVRSCGCKRSEMNRRKLRKRIASPRYGGPSEKFDNLDEFLS
jgi:Bacillus phage HNH endonuclease